MFNPLIDAVPVDLEVESISGRPTVTLPLAVSEDEHQWVALEVRLWPGHWRGVPCHEFKFAIVHHDDRTDEPAEIFDRYMASGYVESSREWVMPCVQAAACMLIESVQPEIIYRATYFSSPPTNPC